MFASIITTAPIFALSWEEGCGTSLIPLSNVARKVLIDCTRALYFSMDVMALAFILVSAIFKTFFSGSSDI
jgi:hypothetical protein